MTIDKDLILPDGSLHSGGWYLNWDAGDSFATLDGQFSAQDLRDIADHMDNHAKGKEPF